MKHYFDFTDEKTGWENLKRIGPLTQIWICVLDGKAHHMCSPAPQPLPSAALLLSSSHTKSAKSTESNLFWACAHEKITKKVRLALRVCYCFKKFRNLLKWKLHPWNLVYIANLLTTSFLHQYWKRYLADFTS